MRSEQGPVSDGIMKLAQYQSVRVLTRAATDAGAASYPCLEERAKRKAMAGRRGRTLARLVLCGGVFLLWTGALGYKRLLGSGAGHADHRDTAGFGKECEQSAAGNL